MSAPKRIVVGISGASGAALGLRALELLSAAPDVEVHLVMSPAAERVAIEEIGRGSLNLARQLAHVVHDCADVGASLASGSVRTDGMLVAPCSMRTLSVIAYGNTDNLLTRAADVHLKERRPLVLLVRESPLHLGHIRAMAQATEAGAIVAPAVPAFYLKPVTAEHWIDQIARRALALLGLGSSAPQPVEWGANAHFLDVTTIVEGVEPS